MVQIAYDILKIFIGFILGIFFEKWTERRNEKKWVRKALISILDDLALDYRIFKPVIKMDRGRLDRDKKLVNQINEQNTSEDLFQIFDAIFKNSEDDKIWSNVTNDESNYIDLNRANYDNFVKNAQRDDLKDNGLKANLDWLFEGLIFVYRKNRDALSQAEYDLKIKLAEIGYPSLSFKNDDLVLEQQIKSQICSYFEIYFEYREKDLLAKKSIVKSLKRCSERIRKNLDKPIISEVYTKKYKIPSLD